MPFRFDQTSQKVVEDYATANTKTDLAAHDSPKTSSGKLATPPGNSGSKIPAGKMDKSRHRTSLGETSSKPDLSRPLKIGFIVISLTLIGMTGIIYLVNQQTKFSQNPAADGTGADNGAPLTPAQGQKTNPTRNQSVSDKTSCQSR